jgi:hypothetical protein
VASLFFTSSSSFCMLSTSAMIVAMNSYHLSIVKSLCNSPATFQRLMQHIFNDTVFQILLIYLDDLIIYSTTIEEHMNVWIKYLPV